MKVSIVCHVKLNDTSDDSGTEENNFYHNIFVAKRLNNTLEFYAMELRENFRKVDVTL